VYWNPELGYNNHASPTNVGFLHAPTKHQRQSLQSVTCFSTCVCVRACVCQGERVCEWERQREYVCVSVCERKKERERVFALVRVFPLAVARCVIGIWVYLNRNLGFTFGAENTKQKLWDHYHLDQLARYRLCFLSRDMGLGNYLLLREVAEKYIYLVWVYTCVYIHIYMYVYEYTCICLYVRSFQRLVQILFWVSANSNVVFKLVPVHNFFDGAQKIIYPDKPWRFNPLKPLTFPLVRPPSLEGREKKLIVGIPRMRGLHHSHWQTQEIPSAIAPVEFYWKLKLVCFPFLCLFLCFPCFAEKVRLRHVGTQLAGLVVDCTPSICKSITYKSNLLFPSGYWNQVQQGKLYNVLYNVENSIMFLYNVENCIL